MSKYIKELICDEPMKNVKPEEFSFLMDTNNNNSECEEEMDVQEFLAEIRQINNKLTERMSHMDQQLNDEIRRYKKSSAKRHEFMGITTENEEMFNYSQVFVENKQFQTSSNFQIDEHQNFVKIKNAQKLPIMTALTLGKENRSRENRKKRVYQSILSKYSTASLIAMNQDQY